MMLLFSQLRKFSIKKSITEGGLELYALIRVDTHGCRFLVKQKITLWEAKDLERHYDSMPHHQGYYVVKQSQIQEELEQKS